MRKKLCFITLFLISSLHATAKEEIKIAIVQEWNQFNPVTLNLASTQSLIDFVVRGVVRRSASGGVLPDIAESIPSFKNKTLKKEKRQGAEVLVAEWTLKSKAQWGDGKDITCDDWILGWKIGSTQNVGAAEKQPYEKILQIVKDPKNSKKCLVTYKTTDWTFDRDLPPLIPAHIEEKVYVENQNKKEGYDQSTIYVRNPTNAGLYNGPYKVVEFKIGSHFILTPNPYFYGQKPTIKKVTVRHIGDTSTIRANLLTGQIDMISSVGFPPDTALQLDEESEKKNLGFRIIFRDSPIFQGLFFNNENEILKHKEVRQAIALLIDKKSIVDSFFSGKLQPAETMLSPQNMAFLKRSPVFNKRKAEQLLESSGWKKDTTGIRFKDGKRLSLLFRTSSGIKVLETIQSFICDQLKSSGIECIIKNQPPRVFLGETIQRGDFALGMFGMPVYPDTSLKTQLGSSSIPNEGNSWTGGNNLRISSPRIDQFLKDFDKEWDFKRRTKLMKDLEAELHSMIPFVPVYHRREAVAVPKDLQGFEDSFSGTDFVYPEKWLLK